MKIAVVVTLALIAFVIGTSYGAYKYGHHQGFAQAYRIGYQVGDKAGYKRGNDDGYYLGQAFAKTADNEAGLRKCLDGVDSNVSNTISKLSGLTNSDINTVVNIKNQQIQECQLRYPTH
jgi:hypothetical protein